MAVRRRLRMVDWERLIISLASVRARAAGPQSSAPKQQRTMKDHGPRREDTQQHRSVCTELTNSGRYRRVTEMNYARRRAPELFNLSVRERSNPTQALQFGK